jgi:phenylalanyl-tRNA synthetase alpha chain
MLTVESVIAAARDIIESAPADLTGAVDADSLEAARVRYLGKKGLLSSLLREIGNLAPQDRQRAGAEVNEARKKLEHLLDVRGREVAQRAAEGVLARETVDITMPGYRRMPGRLHPITQTIDDMRAIFTGLGFSYDDYSEIQTEYHNFDALNTPEWHPARDMHDTFYVGDRVVLRTHTTSFQSHVFQRRRPPIRAVTSGRCYRKDEADSSHFPVFHQFDGLAVDTDISFAELKGTLKLMAARLFREDTEVRFRPSFFPFTTPSAEMDVSCVVCKGSGCGSCKGSGWLELLGCGMVHPAVLREAGLDPSRYRGFAFGIGVERIAMKRYGISDIRWLYQNDLDLLRQL